MRIAIISDIHGNLPALEAALADLRTRPVDAIYCLGDLVGYAAHPNEVTDRIREEGIPTIMGNYDDGAGFERDECGCAYTNPIDKALGDQSLPYHDVRSIGTHRRGAFRPACLMRVSPRSGQCRQHVGGSIEPTPRRAADCGHRVNTSSGMAAAIAW